MRTYGKLLLEGKNSISLFDRVEASRLQPDTIAIEESEMMTDGRGHSERCPMTWANFWYCSDENWTQAHEDAIRDAITTFDTANPAQMIPAGEVMIFTQDGTVQLTKNDLMNP